MQEAKPSLQRRNGSWVGLRDKRCQLPVSAVFCQEALTRRKAGTPLSIHAPNASAATSSAAAAVAPAAANTPSTNGGPIRLPAVIIWFASPVTVPNWEGEG